MKITKNLMSFLYFCVFVTLIILFFSSSVIANNEEYLVHDRGTIFLPSLEENFKYPAIVVVGDAVGSKYRVEDDFKKLFSLDVLQESIVISVTDTSFVSLSEVLSQANNILSSKGLNIDEQNFLLLFIDFNKEDLEFVDFISKPNIRGVSFVAEAFSAQDFTDIIDFFPETKIIFSSEINIEGHAFSLENDCFHSFDEEYFSCKTNDELIYFFSSKKEGFLVKTTILSKTIEQFRLFNFNDIEVFPYMESSQELRHREESFIAQEGVRAIFVAENNFPDKNLLKQKINSFNPDFVFSFNPIEDLGIPLYNCSSRDFSFKDNNFIIICDREVSDERIENFENGFVFSKFMLESSRDIAFASSAQQLQDKLRNSLFLTTSNSDSKDQLINGIRQLSTNGLIVLDIVDKDYQHYFLEFPNLVTEEFIPDTPQIISHTQVLPEKARKEGFLGLYDYVFSFSDNSAVLRAIARYPLAIGAGNSLESIVAISGVGISKEDIIGSLQLSEGITMAGSEQCHYYFDSKNYLRELNPQQYGSCSGDYCKADCPSNAIINNNINYLDQCSDLMGAGSNCWHNSVEPNSPNPAQARSYCSSGCGVASMKMGLDAKGITHVSSQELFCGGPLTVYFPGGSRRDLMVSTAKTLGLENSYFKVGIDWEDIAINIAQGNIVLFSIDSQNNNVPKERPFETPGHFMVISGISNNLAIVQDPSRTTKDKIILSRPFVEGAGRHYVVLS